MGTDNFIPPPLAPSPFFPFFIWLFISCPPASQPASQPVTCYLSARSQLSALWLLASEWGSCFKSCARIILREMLLPTRNPKDMGLWQWVCIYVWGDSIRMGVFMAHCTGTAAPFTHTLTHTDYVTSALLVPPPPVLPPFVPLLVCIPLYYSIRCIWRSRYPGRNSATALPCDQPRCCPDACSALFQQRKKPRGDSLGDRLITAFHQSPLRPGFFAIGSWQEPTFSIFTFPQFFPVVLTCSGSFFFFFSGCSVCPAFLSVVLTSWHKPLWFSHRGCREREKRDRGIWERGEMGERKCKGERLARDDSWHGVWESGVMAERAMEKANQQLVTPYITLRGGLLGIDFRDHGSLTVDVWVINRGMRGWIVEGCRNERECPGWRGYQLSSSRGGACGWAGPLSKKGLGLSQDFHNGIKAERGG